MTENEAALQGTVISVSESDLHYHVRIYCRVQVVSIELPREYRKPELGEDVTLYGNFKIHGVSPSGKQKPEEPN